MCNLKADSSYLRNMGEPYEGMDLTREWSVRETKSRRVSPGASVEAGVRVRVHPGTAHPLCD